MEAIPADTLSLFSDDDRWLWSQGRHFEIYNHLGAHRRTRQGRRGVQFGVWAPNAEYVSVIGSFNDWDKGRHPMRCERSTGIWETFVPDLEPGAAYKYHVASQQRGYCVDKADPVGFYHQVSPTTGSIVHELHYDWQDRAWMAARGDRPALRTPLSIYEVHLGSFRRVPEEGNRSLWYRELADWLVPYVKWQGFTHVEFLPITEHPFFGSWGYQTTGYFAPTSRYGPPEDFMALIDRLHQAGIGVILDWVPSHFPSDEHGLAFFDGTHLYEHADPRKGFHPDWNSLIFNYGRNEVRNFLISSALFWLDRYHVDGLRVDAVASMLYLDYSRRPSEWVPNEHGGRENLEAIALLRQLNEEAFRRFPGIHMMAEESTSWPMVSRPTHVGGLGFDYKWDMGWMHDTLSYFLHDPVHRKFHHNLLTFRSLYAFTENFILSLSHDEVVHGKGSLLGKMPGDVWQRFANLRLLYTLMYAHPGKKLLFMGQEFGQATEWNHDLCLDWDALEQLPHAGVRQLVQDLNRLYREERALHELDVEPAGFEWVDCNDTEQSIISFIRRSASGESVLAVFNFTSIPRDNYRIGVSIPGYWKEIHNSNADLYGGTGLGNAGGRDADPVPFHGRPFSLLLTLPPLTGLYFKI